MTIVDADSESKRRVRAKYSTFLKQVHPCLKYIYPQGILLASGTSSQPSTWNPEVQQRHEELACASKMMTRTLGVHNVEVHC